MESKKVCLSFSYSLYEETVFNKDNSRLLNSFRLCVKNREKLESISSARKVS